MIRAAFSNSKTLQEFEKRGSVTWRSPALSIIIGQEIEAPQRPLCQIIICRRK